MEIFNIALQRLRSDLTVYMDQVEKLQLQLIETKRLKNNKNIHDDFNSKENFNSKIA